MPLAQRSKRSSLKSSKKLQPSDFVHLHNHTHYSTLDGLTKVPKLIERIKLMGMESVAITDHGTMSGVIEFYKFAKNADINPVIGMEAYIAPRKHTDKDPHLDKQYFHLTLLAMNHQGYENLMRLSTIANLEGFYYKPRIDRALLEKYNTGIIALSGCIGGEVSDAFRNKQDKLAIESARWYHKVFGDRYYLELQDHGYQWAEQKYVNDKLYDLSKKLNIPAVVTCDAHYLRQEDQEAHEVLLCVQTGAYLSDKNRMSLKDLHLFVEDPNDIIKRWGDKPELIKNTKIIANRCQVELEFGNIYIPEFPISKKENKEKYFDNMVWRGLGWRYGGVNHAVAQDSSISDLKQKIPNNILERANYEIRVIKQMGFVDYFLIVADFVNWGKNQGIVFGPGRGSAAGSIISYALNITDLDPFKYDLLFERFLNPDRISMPDIDIDIQDNRRDEVIEYVSEKYGHDRVANIVTFGKMAARNSIRNVARVMEVSYAEADKLAKIIPPPVQGRHTLLEDTIYNEPELKHEYDTNETAKNVIDMAIQLEGTINSHGVHAAGVVIAPDEIVRYTPLEAAQKGVIATQYSMNPIEDIGLLKMDFLGLSNLTIIKNALRIIKKVNNEQIDISQIPLDDKATYDLLSKGDTTGVFQLESTGMKRHLKELKPTVFEDIIAMVALYRPGPMQWIDDFISRKHGRKKIEYLHPSMEPALNTTYGVIVYQEQVMQISKDMCGFTGGQADTLRKAIGKKIPEVLAKLKDDFINGAIKTVNADRSMMERFWRQLEEFAAYCFNKSHAACYAMIAYQTAYLKAHYPAAFMAALMTSSYNATDRLALMINECNSLNLKVLLPDINQSYSEFAVVPNSNQIRFGLAAIKNVGIGVVEEIIETREKKGKFTSIEDFIEKVNSKTVNRKTMESLIKTGAFDEFNDRDVLLSNLDSIIGLSSKINKEKNNGQIDLFGNQLKNSGRSKLNLLIPVERVSENEKLQWERELIGIYLSSHPLDDYRDYLIEKTVSLNEITVKQDGLIVELGGVITAIKEITTRNSQNMAFATIEDLMGSQELIIFPKTYENIKNLIKQDSAVLVTGKISTKDRDGKSSQEIKILVEKLEMLDSEKAKNYKPTGKKKQISPYFKRNNPNIDKSSNKETIINRDQLYIHIDDSQNHDLLLNIKKILNKHPGNDEVILVLGNKQKSALRLPFKVNSKNGLLEDLGRIIDRKRFILKVRHT